MKIEMSMSDATMILISLKNEIENRELFSVDEEQDETKISRLKELHENITSQYIKNLYEMA